MKNSYFNVASTPLSRRALLLGAGGGLATSLIGNSGLANALGSLISPPSSVDPQALKVIRDYFLARSKVTSGGDFRSIASFINPDRRYLIDFEKARFGELSSLGSQNRWNGVIDRVWSESSILDGSGDMNRVTVSVINWTMVHWRPAPIVVHRTAEEDALTRQFPEKYGLNIPDYVPVESGFGTTHQVTVDRVGSRWLISQDGYDEKTLVGVSPDYDQSIQPNRANLKIGKSAPSPNIQAIAVGNNSTNLLGRTFDWTAAYNYGLFWAKARNSAYLDYSNLGGDCANFVSQCFTAGGYPTDSNWSPYTYDWINNVGLRSWLLSSGRGIPTNVGAMGYADIVNYDWHGDGLYDHVAIVTGLPGPRVSCHTTDQYNIPYHYGYSDTVYEFATTLISY